MTLSEYISANITTSFAATPLSACRIAKEYLIADAPDGAFAVMLAVPYPVTPEGPLASFAVFPDYHFFFKSFEEGVRDQVLSVRGDAYVKLFADHSPIDERHAACRAGLGVIGDNALFISNDFGPFVFLGEIICSLTEEELEAQGIPVRSEDTFGECLHCGRCAENCPSGCIGGDKGLCISGLTQKKGLLSDAERDIIKRGGYAWGCDKCAVVCPMCAPPDSYNPFFSDPLKLRSASDVDALTDEEYARYPFSWRRRDIIKRNFDIISGKD